MKLYGFPLPIFINNVKELSEILYDNEGTFLTYIFVNLNKIRIKIDIDSVSTKSLPDQKRITLFVSSLDDINFDKTICQYIMTKEMWIKFKDNLLNQILNDSQML